MPFPDIGDAVGGGDTPTAVSVAVDAILAAEWGTRSPPTARAIVSPPRSALEVVGRGLVTAPARPPATTSAGTMAAVTLSPSFSTTMRSIVWRSWRTLPGHGNYIIRAIASGSSE